MHDKPFSPACERNREPILAVLRDAFAGRRHVLEVGSGTGQHAVHFAAAMPWLTWQCTDRVEYLPGIGQWLDDAGLANTPQAIELDVAVSPWFPLEAGTPPGAAMSQCDSQPRHFDAAYSANTLHIMGWPEVEALFAGLDAALTSDATLAVYGPFNYAGGYTSESNAAFDASLKARDPRMGLRDFAAVDALATSIGLVLVDDVAMPANNRLLVWRRGDHARESMA